MTILSQRDAQWKNILLGFNTETKYNIGNYGCLITCFSTILDSTPDIINTKLKAANAFKAGSGLVIWAKVKQALPLDFSAPIAYDNEGVKQEIATNGFCVVEVDSDGKIDTPNDFHWVVYLGNQQLSDPWTGVIKNTGWYPKVVSYVKCTRIGVPAASDGRWIKDYLIEKGIDISNEGDARARLAEVFNEAAKYDEADRIRVISQARLAEANGEIASLTTENGHLKGDLQTCGNNNIDLKRIISNQEAIIYTLKSQIPDVATPGAPDKPRNWLIALVKRLFGSR